MSRGVTVVLATPADAQSIAGLQVSSWQWAYRGLLPDSLLDGMTETLERRVETWSERLGADPPESLTWIALRHEHVVGFASTGPSRDVDAPPDTGEIRAIYLLPEATGAGIGRELFDHAVSYLQQRGFNDVTLWVLEGNTRARRFYERAGWRPDGATKMETRAECPLPHVRYRIAATVREPKED